MFLFIHSKLAALTAQSWWSADTLSLTRRAVVVAATPGFTLIELLVVIAIIGVLATAVLTAINPAQRMAEAYDSQRRADLHQIATALEAYAIAHNNQYPAVAGWRCDDCGGYDPGGTTYGPDDWIPNLVAQGYLKHLPKDPQNGQQAAGYCGAGLSYGYLYNSNGTNYKVLAYCSVKTGLNRGSAAPAGPYCVSGVFTDSSNPATKLKLMVDPNRYTTSYSVYSQGWVCT